MNMKVLAVVVCTLLVLMVFGPLSSRPVNAAPIMSSLQYKYYSSQSSLFTALLSGEVDSMQYPITYSEYQQIIGNKNFVVEPLAEAGEDEIAFNNNMTDNVAGKLAGVVRDPMNYTDFRNAMNCLVDQAATVSGPILGGFATQCYTQVPDPLEASYVNPSVSGANYPWAFNVTHALQILYNGGWYSHTVYPTLGALITAYGSGTGPLSSAAGTTSGVVYPGNDPNGQWGGNDPLATADAAVANKPIAPLQGYTRQDDARLDLGNGFAAELTAIGCPDINTPAANIDVILPVVFVFPQSYDWATLGWSIPPPPNGWYSSFTPAGIYDYGPNVYLEQDGNMTYWATDAYTTANITQFDVDVQNCQDILVMESILVSGYCPAGFCAYSSALLGQIDVVGNGAMANGLQWENWITLDTRKNNTIAYTGAPSGAPPSNIFYIGLLNPPNQINPIFQSTVYDFQVADEIFTYPFANNPYSFTAGGPLTGVPTGYDLPWMAYSWTESPVPNPTGHDTSPNGIVYPTWTNVTVYLRNDITWQDGVPFTDQDINFTIYEDCLYGDAYAESGAVWYANTTAPSPGALPSYQTYFQQDPTPGDPQGLYTFSILAASPSVWNYIISFEVIPYHLYKYIMPDSYTTAEEGASTDGLHGLWPGQAIDTTNASALLPGAPFTMAQLTSEPATTLVGTGPWEYRKGSTSAAGFAPGGGITLDAYPNFFMNVTPGAIAFKYTWLNTAPSAQPSGGYYKIGLSDLVLLANAYGTNGYPGSKSAAFLSVPGNSGVWNPACNLAAPGGSIGLSDLVTLALHYGWYFGNYSYNAPYPPAEIANGGP